MAMSALRAAAAVLAVVTIGCSTTRSTSSDAGPTPLEDSGCIIRFTGSFGSTYACSSTLLGPEDAGSDVIDASAIDGGDAGTEGGITGEVGQINVFINDTDGIPPAGKMEFWMWCNLNRPGGVIVADTYLSPPSRCQITMYSVDGTSRDWVYSSLYNDPGTELLTVKLNTAAPKADPDFAPFWDITGTVDGKLRGDYDAGDLAFHVDVFWTRPQR